MLELLPPPSSGIIKANMGKLRVQAYLAFIEVPFYQPICLPSHPTSALREVGSGGRPFPAVPRLSHRQHPGQRPWHGLPGQRPRRRHRTPLEKESFPGSAGRLLAPGYCEDWDRFSRAAPPGPLSGAGRAVELREAQSAPRSGPPRCRWAG